MSVKKIKSALISVFYKDNLEPIIEELKKNDVKIYSTGGTQAFIEDQGAEVIPVEALTSFPSILGGRVKTLHPKVFGGILGRRDLPSDMDQMKQYNIPEIDLVIVDLYPFEETLKSGASHADIIEKIDIGGISLIRAAAKNYKDTIIVSSKDQYSNLTELLKTNQGGTTEEDRKQFAFEAFKVSSSYDRMIAGYFGGEELSEESFGDKKTLRYGENPHQEAQFEGDLDGLFEQLNGKELSFNNLVDIDATVNLIDEFKHENKIACCIIKHTNACGVALASTAKEAYTTALACDNISAFGGVIAINSIIDLETAEELNQLFFEILIAPEYDDKALEVLKSKKNRILLLRKDIEMPQKEEKTVLNGKLIQDKDLFVESKSDLKVVTEKQPSQVEIDSMLLANKIVKHTKSNAIVFCKDGKFLSSGVGQTSRVDSLAQAVEKANKFGFDLQGSVMASDAFFPFPDCVELASENGVTAIIQPGGSLKDQLSIDACNENGIVMVFTGKRHFKH